MGTRRRALSVAVTRLWISLPQEAMLAPSWLPFHKQDLSLQADFPLNDWLTKGIFKREPFMLSFTCVSNTVLLMSFNLFV